MKRTEDATSETKKPGRPKKKKEQKRANGEGCVYQRPNGLWVGQVIVGRSSKTGKLVKKVIYDRDQSELVAKKNKLLQQQRRLVSINPDSITVYQWIDHFLTLYKEDTLKENTYASYRWMLDHFIKDSLGGIRLAQLQSIHIQSMIRNMQEDGASPRTAEYAFAIVRSAIRKAIRLNILTHDVTLAVDKPKPEHKEVHPLTVKEWDLLFAEAEKESPQFFTLILLEWATGLRRSELLGLKWSDIDFEAGTLTVERAVINGKDGPTISDTKTKQSKRTLTLPKDVLPVLDSHRRKQAPYRLKYREWRDNNLVFPSSAGKALEPSVISRTFARVARKIGLKGVSFHKLRHDHASRLVMAGVHEKKVQAQLGHSSISITMDIYSHLAPDPSDEIAKYLETTMPVLGMHKKKVLLFRKPS